MVKIAYLLMAYKDPEQIKRLVDSLSDSGDFFIHIDKKTDVDPFKSILGNNDRVFFIENRIRVNWGAWSLTEAYLKLLEKAFLSPFGYDRFVFLTGQDYPIMTNQQIQVEFNNNKDTEYIMAYKISTSTIPTDKYKILRRWYFENPFNNKFLRRCWYSFTYRVITKHTNRRSLFVPLNGKNVEPYFGQTLSAFTRKGAELLLNVYHNDTAYNKVMRHVHAPDEEYWHTIIFNSSLRPNTIQKGEEHEVLEHFGFAPLHYHTYIDVCSEFEAKDFETIKNSGFMFFRKVVPGKSDELMDMIDEMRKKS